MAVNPGPVPTEWQETAGLGGEIKVPGKISAERCVEEALNAWEKGRRSVIPGRLIRWIVRSGTLAPRGLQLRVTERLYRD